MKSTKRITKKELRTRDRSPLPVKGVDGKVTGTIDPSNDHMFTPAAAPAEVPTPLPMADSPPTAPTPEQMAMPVTWPTPAVKAFEDSQRAIACQVFIDRAAEVSAACAAARSTS